MLSRNVAHKPSGPRPPAPQAFQSLQRAQTVANERKTPKPRKNLHGAPPAAVGLAGTSGTSCTRLASGGPPSSPPLRPTPHYAEHRPLHAAPTTTGEAGQDRKAYQAPHFSIMRIIEQTGGGGLQLGTRVLSAAATTPATKGTLPPTLEISLDKLGTLHMPRLARGPPFGVGHEHAKHAVDPKPTTNNKRISDDHGMLLARTKSLESRQLPRLGTQHLLRPTRDLPVGMGSEQATPVANPRPAIYEGGGSTPALATPAEARPTEQPLGEKFSAPPETQPTHLSARVLPFGAGYEHDKADTDSQQALAKQPTPDEYTPLQSNSPASEARQLLEPGILPVHRPANDFPLGSAQVKAKPALHPLPGINQRLDPDDRDKLQACAQLSEARQFPTAPESAARIKPKRLARNVPVLALPQSRHDEGDLLGKIQSGFLGARRHGKATAPIQPMHGFTTRATPSFLAREAHEQPKKDTAVPTTAHQPFEGTLPEVLPSARLNSGGTRLKIPTLKSGRHHPGERALGGDDISSAIIICDGHSPSLGLQHATQASPSPPPDATASFDFMPAYQDCLAIADFVAKDFTNETRSELPLTPEGMEHHLRLHNTNCDHLVEMLTATLLRADIPGSEKHTLSLLSKICQHNVLETWPGARLQRQATSRIPRSLMGEFAEFETRRLDFMTETRETRWRSARTCTTWRGRPSPTTHHSVSISST